MHVEDRRPEVHGCAHRAGHRVGDVVELQVEEQRCTAHGEANPVRPLGGKEFLADLHAADRAGQQLGESRSLVDLRGVEADEDALVGQWGRGHGLSSLRSEEHTSELQSLMRISYAVFCLKKKTKQSYIPNSNKHD